MKLRFKITLMVTSFSVLVMFFMSIFYGNYLLQDRYRQTSKRLLEKSYDLAFYIEGHLLDDLSVVKTIQSAHEVEQELLVSNAKYINLSKQEIKDKLSKLNKTWMSKIDKNDPFVKKYTDNKLANFLKKQKKVSPGLYGEIFITNKYGAMIAATGKLTTLEHDYKYWWKECYANGVGKVFFDDRGFDDSVKGYVIGIVSPIKKDGEIIGIIKANINVQSLLSYVLKRYDKKHEGIAKIVRTKGLIVYEENTIPLSARVPKKLSILLKSLKSGVTDIKISKHEKIAAYSPVKLSLNRKDIIFGGIKNSIDHKLGNDGEIWHVVIEKDKDTIFNKVFEDMKNLMIIEFGFIFLLAIVLFLIVDRMSVPLYKLSQIVKKIGQGEKDIKIEPESNDEVGELAISFRDMLKNLDKTTASRDELKQEIKKRIEAQKELKKKDELLIAQSKQAAMGEMIGMIAHQWRQPISVISMAVNNIMIDIELDGLKEENIKECSNEILEETKYLSQTIDDFRNFFKPKKEKETLLVQNLFDNTYKIVGKSFENNDIELNFSGDGEQSIAVYGSELLQVFINILNNAKDALRDTQRVDKKVTISTCKKKSNIIFEFYDNAGGIKEEIISKIFEPYFSTKDEQNGTGLGLYMSKMIIEKHMLGKIWVENRSDGACFMIELPINSKESSV